MAHILNGQMFINDIDVYDTFGVFLSEERKGGLDNLNAIIMPPKGKEHVAVNFREDDGERYAKNLLPRQQGRDITLQFALVANSRGDWYAKYVEFSRFLLQGNDGWLKFFFPQLGKLYLNVFYKQFSKVQMLSNLWVDGVCLYGGKFKVTFHEPLSYR